MVSRRRQMQFERVGMDLEKVKHKVQKIIDECVAENFTMRESRLLAKELDYALDQIEMRSLDSEISKFTNSVTVKAFVVTRNVIMYRIVGIGVDLSSSVNLFV